ncbi:hypothetical protein [Curtobacterium sp. MCBA15_004]|uniref:hypothetical protein n=1 Tax=unclassified Curtobacterium TaxID=257496 RepID=UPI0008DC8DDB|nr:hypothetical protein [Curtobacterium sp. MCBA15_004]WIA96483.1 hypothetical protein QOL16_15500 [Curtobacterium sp. MCBA15_004]
MSRHTDRADAPAPEPTAAGSDAVDRATISSDSAADRDTDTDAGPDTAPDSDRKRRRTVVIASTAVLAAAAVVAAIVVVRVNADAPAEAVSATAPVPITVGHVPDGTKIGVVVTLGDGEGSEWADAAQGALVAERRLALGGTDVQLVTQNDGGSVDGARKAVETLVQQGVAGIVVATSGQHVSGALAAASTAGVPVVAPYAAAADDAWSTAPSTDSVASALQRALGRAQSPLLVDLGGGAPAGLRVAHLVDAVRDPDTAALAASIAQRTGVDTTNGTLDGAAGAQAGAADSDAVVLSGPGARQGALVAALQAAKVTVPVVLTSDATSPAFTAALTQAGGSLSGDFRSVGVETDDARALATDAEGRAMSAYLGGLRVLADDAGAKNLTGDRPFAAVAAAADARSHDAVVALVAAVGSARAVEPAAVTDALARLDLRARDGLAGPALDFGSREALRTPATVLAASSQDLGLRPASRSDDAATAPLVWFADTSRR